MRSRVFLTLSAVVVFASCGPQEELEADELATSELEIRAGTENWNWPAIGRVVGSKGSCTGTLVRSDLVLTAAHCVIGNSNMKFIVYRSKNNAASIDVKTAYYNTAYRSKDDYNYDVAILRLPFGLSETPIPIDRSSLGPSGSTKVAMWGFAGGVKRYREYAWSTKAQYLQGGDSGGPVVRYDTGRVFRVNSAYSNRDWTAPLSMNGNFLSQFGL